MGAAAAERPSPQQPSQEEPCEQTCGQIHFEEIVVVGSLFAACHCYDRRKQKVQARDEHGPLERPGRRQANPIGSLCQIPD
jgi:hypothetical protein